MEGFEKYTAEIESFKNSKLFKTKYQDFIIALRTAKGPFLSYYFEDKLAITGAELRALVHFGRCSNMPICSNQFGYWIAKDENDYHSTIEQIEGRYKALGFMLARMKQQQFYKGVQMNLFKN